MIHIFTTGGTIDDIEQEFEHEIHKQSLIPDLIVQANITLDISITNLIQKDSKFINEKDRSLIYQKVLEIDKDKIIITHGTMTMAETAKYLGSKNIEKTIIITGAMIPFNKPNSDALFNIGVAIAGVQLLSHGIYISMNGKIFSWNNVVKNQQKGIFETLN